jgi:hypothetical protein
VFPSPTGCMLWSFGFFSFCNLRYILQIPLKWSVVFLKSWTLTGCFSNSIGSSVTSGRFSEKQGEPTACYRWTGWARETTDLKFKTRGKMTHHFRGIWGIYLKLIKKNWFDLDFDRLWPKISPETGDGRVARFCNMEILEHITCAICANSNPQYSK